MTKPFILKYRWRPWMVLLFIIFIPLVGFGGFLTGSRVMFLLSLAVTLLMFIGLLGQLYFPRKNYHLMVDPQTDRLAIDKGFYKTKYLVLSEVRGVSYGVQRVNGATTYLFQLAVSPDMWSDYYNKKTAKREQVVRDFEEMYLVISMINQKEDDLLELCHYLEECGCELRPFVSTILGRYPGKPRRQSASPLLQRNTPVQDKQKRHQLLSYFITMFVIQSAFLYIALQFFGRIVGIFW